MKSKLLFLLLTSSGFVFGQEVDKNIVAARQAYEAGKLEDSRFAMEQALRELDLAIGKEIMAELPAKIGPFPAVAGSDVINAAGSGLGLVLSKKYGTEVKGLHLDIINNSPLIAGVNTILSLPIAGLGNPDQKQVKIQGYKALLTKHADAQTGKVDFDLQVPIGNTLMTFHAIDANESDVLTYAQMIPLAKVAQLGQ